MKTEVYLNTDTNVSPANNFSTTQTDDLPFYPEDRLAITQTFLRHIASCNLTPRRTRIILAVFNQTVGFQKLEDDMNGVRLQQLTGIAPNHANSTVRELARFNVLVTRRGKYGNYMAINFAFDQWGSTDKDLKPVINPCCLLPEEDDDNVIDNGLDLSMDVPLDDEPELADAPSNAHDEQPVKSPNSTDKTITVDAELIQQLLDAIKNLSDRIDQLEKNQQQATPIATPEPEPTPTPQPKPEPKQQKTSPALALRYPSVFSPAQCQQASTILQRAKDSDKAQLLLDMLEKRLKQQHDPLRNPMRYLETLVTKLNNNQLSINSKNTHSNNKNEYAQPKKPFVSTTTSITGEASYEPSAAEKIHAEYQEAFLDHQHMEQNITMLAQKDNVSFDEVIKNMAFTPFWEQVKARFEAAKEALTALTGEQVVTA